MYFKITEIFDYKQDKYVYNIAREGAVIRTCQDKAEVEKFVMDRACLFDVDRLEYGWGTLGEISGREAREILANAKQDIVPTVLTGGSNFMSNGPQVWVIKSISGMNGNFPIPQSIGKPSSGATP